MKKHVKNTIIDCFTGEIEYEYFTDIEWEEFLKQQAEVEANRPLTDKEKITLLENVILDMAEVQSAEFENRVMLENAILELANLIGGEEMVELYVKRIKEAKMTIDQVPALWRDKVQAELNK